ncbi:SDR family oxidoreductase [Cylindrospermopsis raciborskii]|uniref:Short-chain dehydrogenase n=1 Tax=Cylindrospermopsis raciborskii CENA302 TaxID=1170768 RepID=A0A9Q5W8R5_9CYAN|nr:SDR family oxidoreductase [Cylindrospermopsis raciborskii]OPH09389.1 hypothetical protein CENA302_10810 [Cylindrospermopsis raciborskii CENA302]
MIKQKVALVTGASRGIGKTVALGLIKDGFRLALVARSAENLQAVASEIVELNLDADSQPLLFPIDITQRDSVQTIVAEIDKIWGRIDLFFNNAGTWIEGTLDVEIDELDRIFSVNLKAGFYFLQAVVPIMKRQGFGQIVNLVCITAKGAEPDWGIYSASKYAFFGLTEAIHFDLIKYGIKVTAICPSWVDTNMAQQAATPYPSDQMIQKEDILNTIRWLIKMSPKAAIKEVVIDCISEYVREK